MNKLKNVNIWNKCISNADYRDVCCQEVDNHLFMYKPSAVGNFPVQGGLIIMFMLTTVFQNENLITELTLLDQV